MATNKTTYLRNLNGAAGPLRMLGKFQAGATAAVKKGEILELSGGNWIPLASDKSMAAIIAVADEEIKNGDRAGYYWIIVPRPGDVFEFALAVAAAVAVGAALYWSDSQTLATSGSNAIGYSVGQGHYPEHQGHLTDDASGDAGTTVRSTSYVEMAFKQAASYYAAVNP